MDSICATVQQHSHTFEMLQKSLATQLIVMADMMVKLEMNDKSHQQPPLLPLPINSVVVAALGTPAIGTHATRLLRLENSLFSGCDAIGWLYQANHFFKFHQVPEDQKVC